jgi:hypothetical protein
MFKKYEKYAGNSGYGILIDNTNFQEYAEAVRDSMNIMLTHIVKIEVNGRRYEKVDIDHYEDTFSKEIIHNFIIVDIILSAMIRGKEVMVLDSIEGSISF